MSTPGCYPAAMQTMSRPSDRNLPAEAFPWRAQAVVADAGLFASPPYRDLFASAQATAFQHPVWMEAFAHHVAPGRGATVHLVTVSGGSGQWLAALPLITRSFSGATLLEAADLGVSDYCAPVIERGLAGDAGTVAALAGAMAAVLPAHDVLRFRNLRPEHVPFFEALARQAAAPAGFGAHATALAPSRDEWRATALSPSFDKYLARRTRKVAKLPGASLEGIGDDDEAAKAVAVLATLRAGRFEGDMIARPEVEAFYAGIARKGTASGFCRVHRLRIDGRTAGVTLGVRHAGAHHYLLIGCDYAAFGALSPGLVLYDFAIGEWIDAKGDVFDFTIGDEPFKFDFGTRPTPICEIEKAGSLLGRTALIARALRKRIARPVSPAAPGKTRP